MGRRGLIILVAVLVALFGFARHSSDPPASTSGQDPPAFGSSGSVTAHLKVVPTIRSVTVSPGSVDFHNCTQGAGDTTSSGDQMGYPNGICLVGNTGSNGQFPVTVTYTGLAGNVWVSASGAAPANGGGGWSLCIPTGKPACTGGQNQPGSNQFTIMTFAQDVAYYQMLTGDAKCDTEFAASGVCTAAPAEFQSLTAHEGIRLIGPTASDNSATAWNVNITWVAEYPH
jgi:hypothetical protein